MASLVPVTDCPNCDSLLDVPYNHALPCSCALHIPPHGLMPSPVGGPRALHATIGQALTRFTAAAVAVKNPARHSSQMPGATNYSAAQSCTELS